MIRIPQFGIYGIFLPDSYDIDTYYLEITLGTKYDISSDCELLIPTIIIVTDIPIAAALCQGGMTTTGKSIVILKRPCIFISRIYNGVIRPIILIFDIIRCSIRSVKIS